MSANLTPQYNRAEQQYKEAQSDNERLQALKLMLSVIPKHKGTDKLQAEIKRKISQLKEDIQKGGKGSRRQFRHYVDKEGLPQIAIAGQPNVGKSLLLAQLTNATPDIADYPYTTRMYLPGVMNYRNFHIQLVDLPAVSREYMEFWVPEIIKQADGLLLLIDLSIADPLDQLDETLEILKDNKIILIKNEVESKPYQPEKYLPGLVIGNKSDSKQARDNWEVIQELYGERYYFCPVAAATGTNLKELMRQCVEMLDIIRVYSKPPGKEPNREKPFILKNGSKLLDFANRVHHDFANKLKFARVWGAARFDGQRVKTDYVLNDEDVIELHI